MKYKGYVAKITIDEEQEILHGVVSGLTDVVTFQGRTLGELKAAFRDSVDDYLEMCEEYGEEPERPFSGRFVVRMSRDLHRDCALAARRENESLNGWVVSALRSVIDAEISGRAIRCTAQFPARVASSIPLVFPLMQESDTQLIPKGRLQTLLTGPSLDSSSSGFLEGANFICLSSSADSNNFLTSQIDFEEIRNPIKMRPDDAVGVTEDV